MPFAPSDISGLKVWLKSNAGFGGASDGDAVATWSDQSGNGNHFTGAVGQRPLWKTNIAGSEPGILWNNGADNHLTSADLSSLFPSAGTVFIVYDPNGDDGYQLARNLGNDSWTRWDGNGNAFSGLFRTTRIDSYPTSMPQTAGRHSFAIKSSGSTYVAYKDGVAQSAQSAGYNAGTVWYLGDGEGNSSRRFGGYMFEVLIYDTALSDSDITSLETYANALWSYGPVNGTSTPSTVAGVGAISAPTAIGAATALPSATVGVGAVPQPTVSGGGAATASPAVVAGVGAVPAPTAQGNSGASPAAVAGVGLVPAPTVFSAVTALPARVIGIGAVPAPTAVGAVSITALPAAVAAIGRVPHPTADGEGTGGGGGTSEGAADYWSIVLAS